MKGLLNLWKTGIKWMKEAPIISFYTYFTMIFAECAFLWSHFERHTAIAFTSVLLAYIVNIVFCGYHKGHWAATPKEFVYTALYIIVSIGVFIKGCQINFLLNIVLTIIPLIITAFSTFVKEQFLCDYWESFTIFKKTFYNNKTTNIVFQMLLIGSPYIMFTISVFMIDAFPIYIKILIAALYLLCMPLIFTLEDELLCGNIFEIAFDNVYGIDELLIDLFSKKKNNKK